MMKLEKPKLVNVLATAFTASVIPTNPKSALDKSFINTNDVTICINADENFPK